MVLGIAIIAAVILLENNHIVSLTSLFDDANTVLEMIRSMIVILAGVVSAVMLMIFLAKQQRKKKNENDIPAPDTSEYHQLNGIYYRTEETGNIKGYVILAVFALLCIILGLAMLLERLADANILSVPLKLVVLLAAVLLLIIGTALVVIGIAGNRLDEGLFVRLSNLEKCKGTCCAVYKNPHRKKPHYIAVYDFSAGTYHMLHRETIQYSAKNRPDFLSEKDIYFSREKKRAITKRECDVNIRAIWLGTIIILLSAGTAVLFFALG